MINCLLVVIIFAHCSIFNKAEVTWEVSSTVQPPVITAIISKWYTIGNNKIAISLITETNTNSNLTVTSNAFLILRCQAPYPVRWFNNDREVIEQVNVIFLNRNLRFEV